MLSSLSCRNCFPTRSSGGVAPRELASPMMSAFSAANATEDPVQLCNQILNELKNSSPVLETIKSDMDKLYKVIENIDYDQTTFDKINIEMTQIADVINSHSSDPDWDKITTRLNALQIEIQAKKDLPKDTLAKFLKILQEVLDTLDRYAPGESTQDLYQKLDQLQNQLDSQYKELKGQIDKFNETVKRSINQAFRKDYITRIGTQIIDCSAEGAFNDAKSLLKDYGGNSDDINSAIQKIYRPKRLKTIITFLKIFSLDSDYKSIYPHLYEFVHDKIQYDNEHDPDLQGDPNRYYVETIDQNNKIARIFAKSWGPYDQFYLESKYADYDWVVYTDIMKDGNDKHYLRLKTGKNLTIYARKIITPPTGMTIEVSGKDGAQDLPRAKDATKYGENGEKGNPGEDGGRGGNLTLAVGFVENEDGSEGNLALKLYGGKAGRGQDGGHGYPQVAEPPPAAAADGKHETRAVYLPNLGVRQVPNTDGAVNIRGGFCRDNIWLSEGVRGTNGNNGTNGGGKGLKGDPGTHGTIISITTLYNPTKLTQDCKDGSPSEDGKPGAAGKGQEGGLGGYNYYANDGGGGGSFYDGNRWYRGDEWGPKSYADNTRNSTFWDIWKYNQSRLEWTTYAGKQDFYLKERADKGSPGTDGHSGCAVQ